MTYYLAFLALRLTKRMLLTARSLALAADRLQEWAEARIRAHMERI